MKPVSNADRFFVFLPPHGRKDFSPDNHGLFHFCDGVFKFIAPDIDEHIGFTGIFYDVDAFFLCIFFFINGDFCFCCICDGHFLEHAESGVEPLGELLVEIPCFSLVETVRFSFFFPLRCSFIIMVIILSVVEVIFRFRKFLLTDHAFHRCVDGRSVSSFWCSDDGFL